MFQSCPELDETYKDFVSGQVDCQLPPGKMIGLIFHLNDIVHMAQYIITLVYCKIRTVYCPKNLTFPKAELVQRYPRLVVVVFYLFISI